jgi:hypothetical protein
MANPHITRTLGPIHFEDLDPHRFEDLVRQLAYDFRQWKSIESTGRGGADDGFDIRAYEGVELPNTDLADDDDSEDLVHPMEGNLWMIQCKREKEVGPRKVAKIIVDAVNSADPPYGYILAAPVHFSKAAHDKFREELRARGVMEFFLWGAGELEDMLFQPKNDRILFAFFGISLTTRRRSRTTEIRASVNAKNKLLRTLGDHPHHQSILLRDLGDAEYPYEDHYRDFKERPRWKAYSVVRFHPLGLVVSVRKHYAFLDRQSKKWDFTKAVNLASAADGRRSRDDAQQELAAKGFWEQIARANRATFVTDGLIRFDSIVFIDDKGDIEHKYPHVFVEFHAERGPFAGVFQFLELNEHHHEYIKGLSRISVFPKDFPAPSFGTLYSDRTLALGDQARASVRFNSGDVTIYDARQEYTYLKPTDVIAFDKALERDGQKTLLKITSTRAMKGRELLALYVDNPSLKFDVEQQIGRELRPKDEVQVIEAIVIYDWQIDQNRPVL